MLPASYAVVYQCCICRASTSLVHTEAGNAAHALLLARFHPLYSTPGDSDDAQTLARSLSVDVNFEPANMAKRALIVGCNYPGSTHELKGCSNDVQNMYSLLHDVFGYKPEDMVIMLDTNAQTLQPTGANIKVTKTKAPTPT